MVVPNQKLIENNILNWTMNDHKQDIHIRSVDGVFPVVTETSLSKKG